MIDALWILGYAACSVAAGYCVGLLGIKNSLDRGASTFFACASGPVGLVFVLAFLGMRSGERRRELAEARHRVRLAELAASEREIEKVLEEARR